MWTKRYTALFLAALMALTLTACRAGEDKSGGANMSIYPAKLTAEEEALMDLLDVGMDNYRMFDFQTGSKTTDVQSILLRAYELKGTDWECVSFYSGSFTDSTGRLALTFGKMTEGVRMACQSENGSFAKQFTMEAGEDASSLIYATSVLTGSPSFAFDEEVPLVLQIATSKNEISSYQVDYFGMPRELAKHDYEHVYAITVTFSKNAASDPLPASGASASDEPAPSPES